MSGDRSALSPPAPEAAPGAGRALRTAAVVAVLTYRRAELLAALLTELIGQAAAQEPPATVLVIDNDPAASAADVVRPFAGDLVRYVHEPRPGISAARNRAIDEAGDADVLVFLDDDELPSPSWLAHLTAAWRTWGCAAVAGPVPPRFLGPVDPWVAGSRIYDRPRLVTGELMSGAGAGNLLLDLRQVRDLGLRFDHRFGLTGGEDTMFAHQLVHRGGQIRWCDEAEAVELIPADRLTRRWVLRRSFRSASSWSRAEVALAGSGPARWRLRCVLITRALAITALAGAEFVGAAARRDVAARAHAVTTAAAYAGLVIGAFGYVHQEYGRTAEAAA